MTSLTHTPLVAVVKFLQTFTSTSLYALIIRLILLLSYMYKVPYLFYEVKKIYEHCISN